MIDWTPISSKNHVNYSWQPREGFAFAKSQHLAPVFLSELSRLVPHYALGFVRDGESFAAVAILGPVPEYNAYVNNRGQWLCTYAPASLRGYPFRLANMPSGDVVLCIASDHLIEGNDTRPLFGNENNLAPDVVQFLEFLKQREKSRVLIATACQALADAGVVAPWVFSLKQAQDSEPVPLEGFYRIDSQALNALPESIFAGLRRSGALDLAYAQLLSMAQVDQISRRVFYRASLDEAAAESAPGFEEVFKWDESFNFDFLSDE